jgi:hypothetical protein
MRVATPLIPDRIITLPVWREERHLPNRVTGSEDPYVDRPFDATLQGATSPVAKGINFSAQFATSVLITNKPLAEFSIELPKISVDGTTRALGEIKFTKRTGTFVVWMPLAKG